MHSIEPVKGGEQWHVVFLDSHGAAIRTVLTCNSHDEAMGFCSYLNGGMDPRGYHLEVTCHY